MFVLTVDLYLKDKLELQTWYTLSIYTRKLSKKRSELSQLTYTTETRPLCFSEKLTSETQKHEITSSDSNMHSRYFKLQPLSVLMTYLEDLNRKMAGQV